MLRLTLAAVVVTVLAVQVLAPWVGGPSPLEVVSNPAYTPFVAPGMMGAFVFLLIDAPGNARPRMAVWGGIGEALHITLEAMAGWPTLTVLLLPGPGFALGALLARGVAARPQRRGLLLSDLAPFAIPLAGLAMPFFLTHEAQALPLVYDAVLYRLDGRLGQPAWIAGEAFARFRWLAVPCTLAYAYMPIIVQAAAASEMRSARRPAIGLIEKFFMAALVGYALYPLMPAVGPIEAFRHQFPSSPADAAALPLGPMPFPVGAWRNAMPSLHSTWALLAVAAMTGRRAPYRIGIGIAAAGVLVGTLGLGQHWLVDVAAAGPLVLIVTAIAAVEVPWRHDRIAALAAGLLLLGLWAALIRGGIIPPASVMMVILAINILASLFGVRRLIARANGAASARAIAATSGSN